jgi:hypothetical protein
MLKMILFVYVFFINDFDMIKFMIWIFSIVFNEKTMMKFMMKFMFFFFPFWHFNGVLNDVFMIF